MITQHCNRCRIVSRCGILTNTQWSLTAKNINIKHTVQWETLANIMANTVRVNKRFPYRNRSTIKN